MRTGMPKCRIEAGDSLNGVGSVDPNHLRCTRTGRTGNRTVQRHDSHDGGLSCCSYNSADRERHSRTFFDIVKYALHGPGGQSYCISGSDIMNFICSVERTLTLAVGIPDNAHLQDSFWDNMQLSWWMCTGRSYHVNIAFLLHCQEALF